MLIKKGFLDSSKRRIFSQVNDLYKSRRAKKFELMTTILLEGSEFELVSWKKERNEFGDTILIVKIHKDGSVLESRIENAIPNYNQYLVDYFKVKFCKSIMK